MVAVLDYGMGNVKSVVNALDLYGHEFEVVDGTGAYPEADRLIIPGVGSYDRCSANMKASGLDEFVKKFAASGRPVLGICLGMQILSTTGLENGESQGLDLIPGVVRRLNPDNGEKVPHVGWNNVEQVQVHPLFKGIKNGAHFYFTHSFHFDAAHPENVLTQTNHGGVFASAVIKDNVVGTQFHPEKSQDDGLTFFDNFMSWTP